MLPLTCLPALLLGLFFSAAPHQQTTPVLMLVDKAGQTTSLPVEGLRLADPRQRNAWSLRPVGFAVPADTGPAQERDNLLVQLSNGDSLAGALAPSLGETLQLRLLGGVQIPILIDRITRIEFGSGPKRSGTSNLVAPAEGDRLYRRTSGDLDVIDGTFDSFVEQGIQFQSSALGLRTFGWDEVAALLIEDLGSGAEDLQEGLPVILDLRGNSRLRGQLVRLEEAGCRIRVAGKQHLFGWSALEELIVDDGSLLYLSELPALGEEGRGQVFGDEFEVVWPHVPNGCVSRAGPLRTAGRVFRRGIGTHAPTQVSWAVPAGTLFLRGLVGIDDSALYNEPEYRGSVIFRVFVDAKQVWESPVLSGGAQPLRLPSIDLVGAQEITLEADMAGRYEGDRANWLEMLFVR